MVDLVYLTDLPPVFFWICKRPVVVVVVVFAVVVILLLLCAGTNSPFH